MKKRIVLSEKEYDNLIKSKEVLKREAKKEMLNESINLILMGVLCVLVIFISILPKLLIMGYEYYPKTAMAIFLVSCGIYYTVLMAVFKFIKEIKEARK